MCVCVCVFVLQAFTNKTYPVESNQAKWISELIDFHVDCIAVSVSVLIVLYYAIMLCIAGIF